MKNIHLLPTEKPSRLFKFANQLHLDTIPKDYYKKYNIYITSDEEIKEGDAVIHNFGMGYELEIPCDSDNLKSNTRSKIILTTDQDLNGVQAISDEFLEWFVKNPSCEIVNVIYDKDIFTYGVQTTKYGAYKIIIPQEEPKQETLTYTEAAKKEERIFNSTMMSKQETLEEAAEEFAKNYSIYPTAQDDTEYGFKHGAKWQSERMYSEEDMLNFAEYCLNNVDAFNTPKDLFEQFKKK